MKSPLLYFAIALSAGIAACPLVHLSALPLFILSAVFAALSFITLKRKLLSHTNLYIAIFFLGALSLTAANTLPPDHISKFIKEGGEKIAVKGIVIDDPATSPTAYKNYRTVFTLDVNSCKSGALWMSASGRTRIVLYSKTPSLGVLYGDNVIVEGHSLVRIIDRGHVNPAKAAAFSLRRAISSALERYFYQPALGFLKAVISGEREDLKRSLSDDFIKTGTIHIISVSGTHVALIACILIFLFRLLRLPKKAGMCLAAALVIFYSFVVGLNPPIIRSVIMFVIFALGYILDRDSGLLNNLSVAAFIMLLWDPNYLFDPSFQLSFGSIASIIIIAPALERLFNVEIKGRLSGLDKARLYIFKGLSVSAAAWLGVAPIVAYYFNITSPVSVIANLIVVPAVSLIMIMAFAFLPAAAFLRPILVSVFALAVQGACDILFWLDRALAAIPLAYFRVAAPSWSYFAAYYAVLWLLILPKPIIYKRVKIYNRHVVILALIFINISVWSGALKCERRALELAFLDVGKGDSILVRFPSGGTMLVDGGPGGSDEKFDAGRSVVAPYLWNRGIRRFDALLVTHSHEDHLGGALYILENFPVGCVVDSGLASDNSLLFRRYLELVRKKGIRRLIVEEGDRLDGFTGAVIDILNPPGGVSAAGENESSVAFRVASGGSSALLCGDISGPALDRLALRGDSLRSDILKVPHHGGHIGTRTEVEKLFETVSPKICVISSGEGRRPDRIVREAMKKSNFISYDTIDDGTIDLFLDGRCITAKTYKK